LQIQFKKNYALLADLDHQVSENLEKYIEANLEIFEDHGRENTGLFKILLGLIELTREAIQQKKMNLLGCKMKVYQERMRQMQFLEIISRFKQIK
jgi:hypothetical protein